MVLENASTPTNDQGLSDKPASDPDPYDNINPSITSLQYHIDSTTLPKPIPIIGNLLGYERKFKQEAHIKILLASKELQRPLVQDEVNAIAYWLANRQAITSWGAPIGFIGGVWRAYNTIETFRFPFWQPDMNTFKKSMFGPLKGHSAVLFWHTLRFFAYGLTGNFVGRLLLGSYAMSTSAVGASNDPRLQDYIGSIRKKVKEYSKKDMRHQVSSGRTGKKDPNFPGDVVEESNFSSSEGIFPDENNDSRQSSSRNIYSPGKSIPWATNNPENTSFDDFGRDLFIKNEEGRTSSTSVGNSNVSAWERIRNGQRVTNSELNKKSNPASPQKRRADVNETFDDSGSNSKAFEEQLYAEDDSQGNFGTQVDRERRDQRSP